MRIRQSMVVAGLAALATTMPLGVAQAATATRSPAAVATAAASCDQLLASYIDLNGRIGILQDRLRHAAAHDKPRIIRQIDALQLQQGDIFNQAVAQGCDVLAWP